MAMKRLQIMIEPELDKALEREARRDKISKSELIRRCVRDKIKPTPRIQDDPIWGLVGLYEGDPDDSASIDDVVYGT